MVSFIAMLIFACLVGFVMTPLVPLWVIIVTGFAIGFCWPTFWNWMMDD